MAPFDGLNMAPRPGEPESNLLPGMAAPRPQGGPSGPAATVYLAAPLAMPDTSQPGPVALQEPATWTYDFDPGTGSSRATFNGIVTFTSGGSATAGVTTWNGRSGAVSLQASDISGAGGALLLSPNFLGQPTAPTQAPGDNDTSIATTAFVQAAITANPGVQSWNGRTGAVTLTLGDVTTVGGAP